MRKASGSPALIRYQSRSDLKPQLFCFPFAGGSAAAYRDWSVALGAHTDVVAVEYPGRGVRRQEKPLKRIGDIVSSLLPELVSEIEGPFAFFGHSMGGLVAYALSKALLHEGRQPFCVFISGCRPPSIKRREPNLHELPDTEFVEELRKLEGTPEELLLNEELMRIAFPVLRADFEAVATYSDSVDQTLACRVFVYGGIEDQSVGVDELEQWRGVTQQECVVRLLPGRHFFIQTEKQTFLRVLAKDMLSVQPIFSPRVWG